ncbi:R3H domain-containing nucleic acid-binding protein [Kamptonema cortianum]|nr:R3H domain-containing nucleic acid-binding protein [Geitlerinema splendidum]MDK3161161.1 R3H domain-containing nucleic acid-binding protein [Kamptonema cortianum]
MSKLPAGLLQLLEVLPPMIREKLEAHPDLSTLVEVVLDYGRPAEARFMKSFERWPGTMVTEHDIEYVVKAIGAFGADNRAGIERTLHRISAIRNRQDKVIGLTCRVGRAMEGTIDIIDDIVRSGQSILILGKPGVGKTTKLREVARVLADEANKRVVIVDTSNEIAGDGDIPHPGIGSARRMQVPNPELQHSVMIEAVENHMPEVVVIDEIGNESEAQAARTIAERGVQLIATAHGQTLENLMLNPALCDLVGGIQAVTLSDDEAKRRGTQKTVLERKAPPTFDVVVELLDFDRLAVHHTVQKTVDLMLRGISPRPELRVRTDVGEVEVVQREFAPDMEAPGFNVRIPSLGKPASTENSESGRRASKPKPSSTGKNVVRIFPYGIARTRLERAIREKKAPALITNDIEQADAIIAMRTIQESGRGKLKDSSRGIPTVVVKSNTFSQIANAVEEVLKGKAGTDERLDAAMEEAAKAAQSVIQSGKPVELAPQDARVRKQQHRFIESQRLASESVGQDPQRRLRILPARLA